MVTDIYQILREAQNRWLRPAEICEILANYKLFQLTPDPPVRPPAGSLFFFDRKVLRYFRKDGHRWRKKKDGKTVKEAHEKLKSGSVDVLHCYYAHGEDNENFQRRCYWMLDKKLEHIVLVHYRDVKEGSKCGSSSLSSTSSQIEAPISSSEPCLAYSSSISSYPMAQVSPMSISCVSDQDGLTMSQQIHNLDTGEDLKSLHPIRGPICEDASFPRQEAAEVDCSSTGSLFVWNKMQGWSRNEHVHNKVVYCEKPDGTYPVRHKLMNRTLGAESAAQDVTAISDWIYSNIDAELVHSPPRSEDQVERNKDEPIASDSGPGSLKKIDSFSRWMDKEIGKYCEGSFMASGSDNYMKSLTGENDGIEVSSSSPQIELDVASLGPSLSQEQLFSISDFSPDWAYSGVDTKVIIAGRFMRDKKPVKWACMFGEFEVSAEVVTNNAIRCHAPPHAAGRVPFYVTCSNRLACSEIREFEYREKPILGTTLAVNTNDEVRLLVRLAKLLSLSSENKISNCCLKDCSKCKLMDSIYSTRNHGKNHWESFMIDSPPSMGYQEPAKSSLIENLLKDKFFEWLFYAVHDDGKGPYVLDDEGQGVIHLAAALGYHWALCPIIATGVSPDFRDACGRPGLHWAAYYEREETVTALSRLHASQVP